MNLSSWSWAIEESDLKKQCDNYNTLKITESYRGISVLIMSAFMALGLIFSFFTSFVTLSNVIIEMIIYVPLCFFIYRGHRWAIILLMLIWTFSQGFQLNEVIQSGSGNKFMPIIWWLIVMPYFWQALKVENERKKYYDCKENLS
ncbi:MAG: hypothetical protein WC748_08440 [Legionellales bacterium]|jgi:hypothetical protein